MKNTYRENTIYTVQSIAWDDLFLELKSMMKCNNSEVIGELMCMWNDDMYHPDYPEFNERFSKEELEAMEWFNQIQLNLRPWENPEEWTAIRSAAQELINRLGWQERAHFNAIEQKKNSNF